MSRFSLVIPFLILLGCQSSEVKKAAPPGPELGFLQCEIGIVGGGPAGVYLAYKLAPTHGKRVCLFEKEATLGGRMRDESLTEPGIWVGTGARRVNEVQTFVLELGKELGIEFQTPEKRSQLIYHKKKHGFSSNDFLSIYPKLKGPFDKDPRTTRDDEIYTLLVKEKAQAKEFPNLLSYMKAIAGESETEFLRGIQRFHADFDYDISPANYLDYLEEENKTSSVNRYPVGGMSAFIRRMEEVATKYEVQFFKSEPLVSFTPQTVDSGYELITPKHKVLVKKLVLAIPPTGMNHVTGPLAEEIRSQPEYQALLPIRIVVINQWWDKAWWESVRDPKVSGNTGKTWRAWTDEHCVNHTEIPQEKYAAAGKVTRSVYSDDMKCVKFWEDLYHSGGIEAVEAEVVKGLTLVFNTPFAKKKLILPRPLKTTMQLWPAGWYFVKAGSQVSNAEISKWSQEPIKGRFDLMMVGEAYWPNRPGWSEGAYFSVNELLKTKFAAGSENQSVRVK